MTVSLDTREDIRQTGRAGVARPEIARTLHVSRDAVARHAGMRDMPPEAPLPEGRARPATDDVAPRMDKVPEDDLAAPRRQRHTAEGILGRLVGERGHAGSHPSVGRHVASWEGGMSYVFARLNLNNMGLRWKSWTVSA